MNPAQKQYGMVPYRKRMYTPRAKKSSTAVPYKAIRQVVRQETMKTKETKSYDVSGSAGINYSGAVYNLTNGITQGTSEVQYVGVEINPSTLRIRWACYTNGDNTNLLRVIVLQTIGGGTPTAANVLESTANIRAPLSPYDRQYNRTYKVLYDELFSLSTAGDMQVTGDIRVKSPKLRTINFTDNLGTVEDNGIFMVVISDSAAVGDPFFSYHSRLYFKDS